MTAKGNIITVCSMENVDPVGVHTGDSIVVAPAVTLSTGEFRHAAQSCSEHCGGAGCRGRLQLSVCPASGTSMDYAVIEVNPRVSRSSALASKATGYPIAKVATKIAIGYTLDEILNAVTGNTYACFEPSVDYLVVKFPKWPFDKFVYAKRTLGTQMMATGEVMSIGTSFEQRYDEGGPLGRAGAGHASTCPKLQTRPRKSCSSCCTTATTRESSASMKRSRRASHRRRSMLSP